TARAQPTAGAAAWQCGSRRCCMPKPCCGTRLAARAVLCMQKMTVGGWPLARKAHIGHDHSLARWSGLGVCRQPECHQDIEHRMVVLDAVQVTMVMVSCRSLGGSWRRRAGPRSLSVAHCRERAGSRKPLTAEC